MSLNTKNFVFLCLLFLSFYHLKAQEVEPDKRTGNKENVMISLGYIQPLPFGDNLVNEAYAVFGGFEHAVWVRPALNIWVGARLNVFFANVEKKELTGNYDNVSIFSIGPMLGYKFHFNQKFDLLLGAGVGYARYTNYQTGYKFYDDGTALWFSANFDYDLSKHFGLFLSGNLRHDFLKTEADGTKENYFDPSYIQLAIGIRITI